MEQSKSGDRILHLWRVTIRGLSMGRNERAPFSWHVATKSLNEKDVVAQARNRLSTEWWQEHIIIEVEEAGDLYIIEGQNLFDPSICE
jgi:hypothetical protein